jgi:hypothetical protein
METAKEVYVLGGIALASSIPLPELPLYRGINRHIPRVNIRIGDVPTSLPQATEIDPDCFANSSQYLLRIEGIASYFVSGGTEITVKPEKKAPALDVRAYLLGTIFAVLCHQRGLLPLHASAVAGPEGAVAFLGNSGQGKSSLAASLAQRGFRVVADDVCLVDTAPDRAVTVIPSAPWLKLWRPSLEHLGCKVEGLEQVFTEDDKYRLPLEETNEPLPISKVIFLEKGEINSGRGVYIEEVARIRALALLMDLTHHAYLVKTIGQREQNFLQCGRVLSQARAFRLVRPWGFDQMEPTVDAVEKSFLET